MNNHPNPPHPAANALLAELDIPTPGAALTIAAAGYESRAPMSDGSAPGVTVNFGVGDNIILMGTMHPDTYEFHRPSGVKVRVYRGHDSANLGILLWDTTFDLPTGALAIGDSLNDEKDHARVDLGRRGKTPIKFYANNTIPELDDLDEVVTDVNILVE